MTGHDGLAIFPESPFSCEGVIASLHVYAVSIEPFNISVWHVTPDTDLLRMKTETTITPTKLGHQIIRLDDKETMHFMKADLFGISTLDYSGVFPVPYATTFEPIMGVGIPLQVVLIWKQFDGNDSIIDGKQGFSSKRAYAFQLELDLITATNETGLSDIHCKEMIDSESRFTSPSYPDYYGSGIECQWDIVSNDSSYITLNFTDTDLGNNVREQNTITHLVKYI